MLGPTYRVTERRVYGMAAFDDHAGDGKMRQRCADVDRTYTPDRGVGKDESRLLEKV